MDKLDANKLAKIIGECREFFEVKDIPEPKISFIYTREEMDTLLGRKTERWERAVSRHNGLYFIHKSKIEELTPHTNSDFWLVVKHEMSHWFYSHITDTHEPRWFNEGLANVVAESRREKPRSIDAPVVEKYFDFSDFDNYSWGYWMVRYLLDELGREKLITLVKSLNTHKVTKDFFATQFEAVYNFDVAKLQDRTLYKYNEKGWI